MVTLLPVCRRRPHQFLRIGLGQTGGIGDFRNFHRTIPSTRLQISRVVSPADAGTVSVKYDGDFLWFVTKLCRQTTLIRGTGSP